LCCVASVFIIEAVIALINPESGMTRVGYIVSSPDALNEYRAVYLGMFGVLGIATLYAARHVTEPLLADVICLAILGEAVARVIGIALDGVPSTIHFVNIVAESTPIVILLIRPTKNGPT